MRNCSNFLLLLFSLSTAIAQVGIGTVNPDATLDVVATNQATPSNTDGILIPRVSAFPLTDPGEDQDGLLVYLTTENSFYFWDYSKTTWSPFVRKIDDLQDGKSDSDGSNNGSSIFLGVNSGNLDDGSDNKNVGIGFNSMPLTTNGDSNVAIGYETLSANTNGGKNTAIGYRSMAANTTGEFNSGLGYFSLINNTTGDKNTAVGYDSMNDNTTGIDNTAIGYQALYKNISARRNSGNGYRSLYSNTTGEENTAMGYNAMLTNNGDDNIAIGYRSFRTSNQTSPSGPTATFPTITSFENSISIGHNTRITSSNQAIIGNTSTNEIGGYEGWSNLSDGRFKVNVNEDVVGTDFIMKLRPVTYNLDVDALASFLGTAQEDRNLQAETIKKSEIRTGFIAQEVEEAAQKLGYSFNGIIAPKSKEAHYAVRYSKFVVPLVKATQEQQQIIEQQANEIDSLKKRLETLESFILKEK